MSNNLKKISTLALFIFLISSLNVYGQIQSVTENNTVNSAEITITPAFPGANQDVYAKIESYSFELNSSEIIWALDGVIKDRGFGKKTFSFKTGDIGSVSLIKALIKTKDGKTIEKSYVVRPAGVDLFWEANSYTPPFYKGKSLYSYQSLITVIALPNLIDSNGVKINPDKLTYKWTRDSKVLGGVSGYGKNKFTFSKSVISHSPEIKVEVESSDKKIKASGSITLDAIAPKTIIYENNPLYGIIYEKAIIGEYKLNSDEITLVTTPYFFSKEDEVGNKINYKWGMNSQNISAQQGEKQKTFRNAKSGSGSTRISVDLQNNEKVLQSARTDVLLNFEKNDIGRSGSF